MYENMAVFAIFAFLYALFSGRLERTPFSGALIFAAFGFLAGPLCLGFLSPKIDGDGLSFLAEFTLALVLFTDASNANLRVLKRTIRIPQRLLFIGLPLTIILGIAFGYLLFGTLNFYTIALISVMLAPTDAALGKAVITDRRVPDYIREGLNVESGLNDGICVPVLYIFLSLASNAVIEGNTATMALKVVAHEIGIGALVGILLTLAGVRLITLCIRSNCVSPVWHQLMVPSLAVACFTVAQWSGGSGFIACFIGGLVFDRLEKEHRHTLLFAAEGIGNAMALATWVVYGSLVVGHSLHAVTWQIAVYSLLSLTVTRMLPVYISLSGLKLRFREKLFFGWFGPRGLASIVFAVIILKRHVPESHTIAITAATVIGWSVLLHGITANPFVRALSREKV